MSAETPDATMNKTPTATDNGLLLETFIPYRLAVLSNMVSQSLADEYEELFGLSIAEWRVMANLGRFEPLSAQAAAEKGSLDKARVTRALARMQKAGLILRKPDPQDKRIAILRLSSKGRRVYEKIAPLALAWEQTFLSALNEQELSALDGIIVKLQRRVREMTPRLPDNLPAE